MRGEVPETILTVVVRRLKGLEHVAYQGLGEVVCDAVNGGGVFLDEAVEVLGGLVLLMKDDCVVAIESVAVMAGQQDFRRYRDQITGRLSAGCIVGQGRDGLRKNSAMQRGIRIGGAAVDNVVLSPCIEFANGGLGESHLGMEGLGAGDKDRHGEGADVAGDVCGGACGMVSATG